MDPIIQAKAASKVFLDKIHQHKIAAVDQVSFCIYPQETVGIIGESGSGKTTLLNLMVGLEYLDGGDIFIEGHSISQWQGQRQAFRKKIQMIYQNPYEVFDRRQTISDILLQPLKIHKIGSSQRKRQDIVCQALTEAGFTPLDMYLNRYPHELSGGQLQRISILRSLLIEPDILVADEPVSMLDVSIRASILELLMETHQASQNTMLVVSHDILSLRKVVDRLFIMYRGKIIEDIPSHRLLDHAVHPYTRVLLSNAHGKEVSHKALTQMVESFREDYPPDREPQPVEIAHHHFVSCHIDF